MSTYNRLRARLAAKRVELAASRTKLAKAERGLAWARKRRRPSVARRARTVDNLRKAHAVVLEDVRALKRSVARHKPVPLRERAYREATKLVGVMEQGGNNRGPAVEKIIRENDGAVGEPWCGDFVAHCYRVAGSKAVTRAWAAVRLFLGLAGIRRTSTPQRGDLVRFTFDHVGLFVRDLGASIETIEGNTGASGAVSDSSTGGDGVYRKLRPKSLVRDYLEVTR